MYKDKDKQREANKAIQARRRSKGVTKGVTESGCDIKGVTFRPACVTCKDMVDNNGIAACDIGGCDKPIPKERLEARRGKDIKCFTDLPLDVQETIDRMSSTTEEHIKRTEAAINYQHLFPGRYEPMSVFKRKT